jgi:hypothetical protein
MIKELASSVKFPTLLTGPKCIWRLYFVYIFMIALQRLIAITKEQTFFG